MRALRRNEQRQHVQDGGYDSWLTFHPQKVISSHANGFGTLTRLDEFQIPPGVDSGQRLAKTVEEAEILTYVFRGALAQVDSLGNSDVILAGEFQRRYTNGTTHYTEDGTSPNTPAHIFRVSLCPPPPGSTEASEHKRFAAAQRRNLLCTVASPDGRRGSLSMDQNVLIFSSILDPGHHLIHELFPGHRAWLHVIRGQAALADVVLSRGDGVGVTGEPSVSLTAQKHTEILLIDMDSREGGHRGHSREPASDGIGPNRRWP